MVKRSVLGERFVRVVSVLANRADIFSRFLRFMGGVCFGLVAGVCRSRIRCVGGVFVFGDLDILVQMQ